MSFIYPAFLWALAAVSIPLIIHLFNFRSYKTVYFSNLAFLSSVQRERKSRSRLKHLLILLARMLAIVALILAFALPFIPQSGQPASSPAGDQYVTIYVDNSYSMNAENEKGSLLGQAKSRAAEIAEGYSQATRFYLITNEFNPAHQHWAQKEEFLDMLNEIQVSPVSRDISEISMRQADHISNTAINQTGFRHTAYWISDFQQTTTDFGRVKSDSLSSVQLMKMQAREIRNLYIDTAWYNTPWRKLYQDETVQVRIRNAGNQDYQDIPLKLYIDDTLKAISNFNIEARGATTVQMNYTNQYNGDLLARLEITDYPITYDNTLYYNYKLSQSLNVAFVSDSANRFTSRLFDDKLINYTHIRPGQLKPNELNTYQAIFLNELTSIGSGLQAQLIDYARKGGTIALIPPMAETGTAYNQMLREINNAPLYQELREQKEQLKTVNFEHKLYQQAFEAQQEDLNLPRVQRYFSFSLSAATRASELLTLQNNDPALIHLPVEEGEIYLFGFNLRRKTSNIIAHPLFVPSLYNIALYSVRQNQLYHTIGGNTRITLNRPAGNTSNVFHIESLKDNTGFIPRQLYGARQSEVNLSFSNQIPGAGYYAVTANEDTVRHLSFNYNRKESVLQYYNQSEIEDQLKRNNLSHIAFLEQEPDILTGEIQKLSDENQLWRLFLLLALLFLALEAVFVRTLN